VVSLDVLELLDCRGSNEHLLELLMPGPLVASNVFAPNPCTRHSQLHGGSKVLRIDLGKCARSSGRLESPIILEQVLAHLYKGRKVTVSSLTRI
jgi:hypothetical protein